MTPNRVYLSMLLIFVVEACQCSQCKTMYFQCMWNSCTEECCGLDDVRCLSQCSSCYQTYGTQINCLNVTSAVSTVCSMASSCGSVKKYTLPDGSFTQTQTVGPSNVCMWAFDFRNQGEIEVEFDFEFLGGWQNAGDLTIYQYNPALVGVSSERYRNDLNTAITRNTLSFDMSQFLYMVVVYNARQVSSGLQISWSTVSDSSSEEEMSALEIAVVIFAVFVCLIGSLICLWVHKRGQNSYRVQDDYTEIDNPSIMPTVHLSREDIERCMPMISFDTKHLEVGEDVCSICYENLKKNSLCRKLQCKHIFHMNCIDEWLTSLETQPRCPMCNENPLKEQITAIISQQAAAAQASGENQSPPETPASEGSGILPQVDSQSALSGEVEVSNMEHPLHNTSNEESISGFQTVTFGPEM